MHLHIQSPMIQIALINLLKKVVGLYYFMPLGVITVKNLCLNG